MGLHDAPWDFWRFSADSWDALFNKRTGFIILDRVQDYEQFILPFVVREGKLDSEKAAGFEASLVFAKIFHGLQSAGKFRYQKLLKHPMVARLMLHFLLHSDLPWLKTR